MINNPWQLGSLKLPHRLIQGPLAGYSSAPFRELFYQFTPAAFCVSEMISARDLVNNHSNLSRYIYRSSREKILSYQISGNDKQTMTEAALLLQKLGADLIDINCGCPKAKIRKKGAGSALLENPHKLMDIIKQVRDSISIPLTIKIRIQDNDNDFILAEKIENSGADALIVHGRRWTDDYDIPCDLQQIARIKKTIKIPVIANGDIKSYEDLQNAISQSNCDAFMISRAGCGRPWLYKELLKKFSINISMSEKISLFMQHLQGLAALEGEFKALLQSKSLLRYYFPKLLDVTHLQEFYAISSLMATEHFLEKCLVRRLTL